MRANPGQDFQLLILEFINGDKVSIGPPYYNAIFAPLILMTSIFIMISLEALWQRGMQARTLLIAVTPTFAISSLILYFIWYFAQVFSLLAYIGIYSGLLIIISYLLKGAISLKNKTYINKGSFVAHLGLGLLFFAVSMNSILSYQKNINLFFFI